MRRRTLVRLLIGLGIGVPVLVEVLTLLGMIDHRLLGDGEGNGRAGTPTRTPRPRVGVDDELLPETPPDETLVAATLRAGDRAWTLELSVEVRNDTGAPYEFRFGSVTTADGTVVEGGASTGRIPPGETASVTAAWELPQGATPDTVDVIAVRFPAGGGTASTVRREVPLARIPARGG